MQLRINIVNDVTDRNLIFSKLEYFKHTVADHGEFLIATPQSDATAEDGFRVARLLENNSPELITWSVDKKTERQWNNNTPPKFVMKMLRGVQMQYWGGSLYWYTDKDHLEVIKASTPNELIKQYQPYCTSEEVAKLMFEEI